MSAKTETRFFAYLTAPIMEGVDIFMKHKNWSLFVWALKRLKIDHKNNDVIYKKGLRNDILLKLMDLSGVTPGDIPHMLQEIDNELERRKGL